MDVDIIMPAYNPDRHIIAAIDSCLSQTGGNVRLTIIDDSSDNPISVLKNRYPGVNFLKTESNLGPSGARNLGIQNTTREFVSFLDADDIMHQDKIKLSLNAMEDSDVGMTCGNYRVLSGRRRLMPPFYKREIQINWRTMMKVNYVASGSVTVRRSVLEDVGLFNEEFWIAEDMDLWLRISENHTIKYINEVLYYYAVSNGNNSLTQRADIQSKHANNLRIMKAESLKRVSSRE